MYSLLESALQSFLQLGEDVSPSTVGKLAKWLKEHFFLVPKCHLGMPS